MHSRLPLLWLPVPIAGVLYYFAALSTRFSRPPSSVAVHFDLHTRPDGWLPRSGWPSSRRSSYVLRGGIPLCCLVRLRGSLPDTVLLAPACATSLVLGAFLEILHVAATQQRFGFLRLLLWTAAIWWGQALPVLANHRG